MQIETFNGTCDVSAAVRWRGWLITTNDEDNLVRAYRPGDPRPLVMMDLSAALEVDPDSPEADLEGAAEAEDGTVYWIGSHGRSKKGKRRRSRERFLASRIFEQDGRPRLEVVGRVATDLLDQLADSEAGRRFDLGRAAKRAPEEPGGLSIEGLGVRGRELLVAFRNPEPEGLGLLVPLQNPSEVVLGSGTARFGEPILLDLGGRGIRAMDHIGHGYLIVAGPFDDQGHFALYFWNGEPDGRTRQVPVGDPEWDDLNPEEIVVAPAGPDLLEVTVFSDDGGRQLTSGRCKDGPEERRRFRVSRFTVPEP